ncbi:hypothetical protein [Halobellus captivus]|uniref:hypothetical protein n=1 Tax=Halobellus captivus TaxID=2592614 RepID=UPI00119D3FEC|nr:hypothetical protein [Halobellus captivus]
MRRGRVATRFWANSRHPLTAHDDALANAVVAVSRVDVPSNRDPTRGEFYVTGTLAAPWYISTRREIDLFG